MSGANDAIDVAAPATQGVGAGGGRGIDAQPSSRRVGWFEVGQEHRAVLASQAYPLVGDPACIRATGDYSAHQHANRCHLAAGQFAGAAAGRSWKQQEQQEQPADADSEPFQDAHVDLPVAATSLAGLGLMS